MTVLLNFALQVLLLPVLVAGNEMAFVDVTAGNTMTIRSLDVKVHAKTGWKSFLAQDPMVSHDWVIQKTLLATIATQVNAANRSDSVAGRRLAHLEQQLASLFVSLPKNEHGLLGNGAVRYALHRYFTVHHGWSLKGLEPAGGAWTHSLRVTLDVKQVSKYIVPAYLIQAFEEKAGKRGLDLHTLAVLVSTIEHLVHAEMTDHMYMATRTMQIYTAGNKTAQEMDDIFAAFLVLYAFGTNLEVSDHTDVMESLKYLNDHHPGWKRLEALAREQRRNITEADFPTLVRLGEEIADHYAHWQSQDCNRVRDGLKGPAAETGSVPLSRVMASREPGYRPLFVESAKYMRVLGTLGGNAQAPQLVVPNYLASTTMCLSTASFYSVCCPNQCTNILDFLERKFKSPWADASAVAGALQKAYGIQAKRSKMLVSLGFQNGGKIQLHGLDFAKWLHEAFPIDCPLPGVPNSAAVAKNPRTANEWMEAPRNRELDSEELITEYAFALSRFTSLGGQPSQHGSTKVTVKEPIPRDDVVSFVNASTHGVMNHSRRRWRFMDAALKIVTAVSMIGLACTLIPRAWWSKRCKSKTCLPRILSPTPGKEEV